MTRKIFNKKNFKNCKTGKNDAPELLDESAQAGVPFYGAQDGLANTSPPRPFITFNAAQGEKVIAHGNAYLVFGTDRPSGIPSGMGASGFPNSDMIDLVVGRMAAAYGGKGPCDGMFVSSNMVADAARIYISSLTLIDKNFGIARRAPEGKPAPDEQPRSGIGIKADKVRIIGRDGIKIISGGAQAYKGLAPNRMAGLATSEANSVGGATQYHPRIDLLAGNYAGSSGFSMQPDVPYVDKIPFVQPLVKGGNLMVALNELSNLAHSTLSSLNNLSSVVNKSLVALGADTNLSKATIGVLNTQGIKNIAFTMNPTYRNRSAISNWQSTFTVEDGDRWIGSRHISCT